jgi:hypothetical protein
MAVGGASNSSHSLASIAGCEPIGSHVQFIGNCRAVSKAALLVEIVHWQNECCHRLHDYQAVASKIRLSLRHSHSDVRCGCTIYQGNNGVDSTA